MSKETTVGRRAFVRKAGVIAGATAAGAAASSFPAPAIAQSRKEMSIVCTWPRDFPGLGISAQRLAERIPVLTEGRIHVNYFASGEKVGAFDSFDEVASGQSQAYIATDYYWKGKHPGWAYYAAVPFGLVFSEMQAWINWGGGQELWHELGDQFGVINFACGNTGVQMGGWFRDEMESADDFKGLKMRIPGLGGDVLAKLGASPVSLPGSQIYENLVSGAVDATEWVGPFNDFFMKFYEAAKYYYYPGMHEPGSQTALGVNKSWWGTLSKTDQEIIKAACAEENGMQMSETNAKNGEFLERLIKEQGVELRRFNDDIYDSFGEAAEEVFAEVREHSDLAARIHDSFAKARSSVGAWTGLSDTAFTTQRNRVLDIGF